MIRQKKSPAKSKIAATVSIDLFCAALSYIYSTNNNILHYQQFYLGIREAASEMQHDSRQQQLKIAASMLWVFFPGKPCTRSEHAGVRKSS